MKPRLDARSTSRHARVGRHPLAIFRDHGYNWGRVHLCSEPVQRLPQTLEYVIASEQAVMMRGRGYFDADGNALPIVSALEKYAPPLRRADGQTRLQ